MLDIINVVGLTTTDLSFADKQYTQYSILTLTRGRYHEYLFTPSASGLYTMKISPAMSQAVEYKACSEYTFLYWSGNVLYIKNENSSAPLFNSAAKTAINPISFFKQKIIGMPKRVVLILQENYESIMPFIEKDKTIAYASEWQAVPSIIPEDVIVMNAKFPIQDVLLRLPKNTDVVTVNSQIQQPK